MRPSFALPSPLHGRGSVPAPRRGAARGDPGGRHGSHGASPTGAARTAPAGASINVKRIPGLAEIRVRATRDPHRRARDPRGARRSPGHPGRVPRRCRSRPATWDRPRSGTWPRSGAISATPRRPPISRRCCSPSTPGSRSPASPGRGDFRSSASSAAPARPVLATGEMLAGIEIPRKHARVGRALRASGRPPRDGHRHRGGGPRARGATDLTCAEARLALGAVAPDTAPCAGGRDGAGGGRASRRPDRAGDRAGEGRVEADRRRPGDGGVPPRDGGSAAPARPRGSPGR